MENNKNVLGMTLLLIIILFFSVGGFFLMRYFTSDNHGKNKANIEEVIKDLRLDKSRDYIYFENGEEVLESEEIHHDTAVFNFSSLQYLNEQLKKEEDELYADVKYTKDMELPKEDNEGNEITYNENDEGYYSLKYRDYDDSQFGNYVSLVVKDYYYDIKDGNDPINLKGYVVDINTGKLVSEDDLLAKYDVTMDKIREKVKERLSDTQVLVGEESVINIEETLKNIDKHALTINKVGKLMITFVVKSNQNNYNDSVVIN